MKKDEDLKIVAIGTGNLIEIIFHCIVNTIGKDRLAQQVIGTTADEADVEKKKTLFGIPVILNENLKALKENRPDIIFFAPPPSVAPAIIEGELKEYVDYLRSENRSLPEIYAFPPVPDGSEYQKILGKDVLVANIIPNNISKICNKQINGEGFYSFTFSSPWPESSKERLTRIFASSGKGLELKSDELVPMLGSYVTILCLLECLPTIAELLEGKIENITYRNLGDFMRAKHQQRYGYRPEESAPCGTDTVPETLELLLDTTITAWHNGLKAYFDRVGFPEEAADIILTRGIDLILHVVQMESLDVIRHHAVAAATEGGVLEKGIMCFHELVKPVLQTAVDQLPEPIDETWTNSLLQSITKTAHIVLKHGLTLAG